MFCFFHWFSDTYNWYIQHEPKQDLVYDSLVFISYGWLSYSVCTVLCAQMWVRARPISSFVSGIELPGDMYTYIYVLMLIVTPIKRTMRENECHTSNTQQQQSKQGVNKKMSVSLYPHMLTQMRVYITHTILNWNLQWNCSMFIDSQCAMLNFMSCHVNLIEK